MPVRTLGAKAPQSVLVVHRDRTQAQVIALALDAAGLAVDACTFEPGAAAQAWERLEPAVVLACCELGSPQLQALVAGLRAAGRHDAPLALLCENVGDEVFVRTLRRGVVELLQAPFKQALHVSRLRLLTVELPERPGRLRGRGGRAELIALVKHLVAARRTGTFTLNAGVADEGRAAFQRGALRGASFKGLVGQQAVHAMVNAAGAWSFEEEPDDLTVDELPAMEEDLEAAAEPLQVEGTALEPDPLAPQGRFDTAPPAPQGRFDTSPPPAVAAAPPPDPEAARWPLLFVDDDPSVLAMLSGYFGKRGYPVLTAADGAQALAVLVANPVEAVVADLAMPRLDGWGFLRLAREDLRTHEVPLAFYSAHEDYRDALRVLNSGAQGYFPKTLRLGALEAQVRELLEPRKRFYRLLRAEGGMQLPFGALGPQWVLRALARLRFSGQLDAKDKWASWRASFEQGRLLSVAARVRDATMQGEQALGTFLASTQSDGTVSPGAFHGDDELGGRTTDQVVTQVVTRLNEERQRARSDQLQKARALDIDPALWGLFVQIGPPTVLPIARLLCEHRATPAEVVAKLRVTPQEVAAVLQDLLRKGVATLKG